MKKTGRNETCPCGSGKKYKQCCLKVEEANTARASQTSAHGAAKALDWLNTNHYPAVQEALYDGFFGALNEDEMQRIENMDDDTYQAIMTNAMEWLLAEGSYFGKGEETRLSDLVLARGGPIMTAPQRAWIESLRSTPLNLYEVLEVIPSQSITFRDLLHPEHEPIHVLERLASQSIQPLDVIAARMIFDGDHHVISGAMYPFHRQQAFDVMNEYRREMEGPPPEDTHEAEEVLSLIIRDFWLRTLVAPFQMPELIDRSTGAPILFVTDHYRVHSWALLEQLLSEQQDVEGSREEGWSRLCTGEDEMIRSLASIEIGRHADRIQVTYRTQTHAEEGKPWLEALLGDAVNYAGREISDPEGVLARAKKESDAESKKSPQPLDDVSPELITQALEHHLRRYYNNWADQPIPMLDDQTPRQAVETPGGLENVKFLLRTYEHDEQLQALNQNRPAMSYAFLWESLGINPEEGGS